MLPDTERPEMLSLESQTDIVDSMSPPHPAEHFLTQNALAQDCSTLQLINQDLEECQLRIAHLLAQMRHLEHQRDAVQRRMSIHRARLSPLRTIPDQILQEIFQHCLPDNPYIIPGTRYAPLVLTHVCRRWRAVAQGTSELWSSVALRDYGIWNYELEIEMVKQWLDRTRSRDIRMRITCPPCTNFGLDGNLARSDVFRLAIAHSAHVRDLCLNVDRTYLHHFLNCANLPVLRSIVISLHSTHRIDEPIELDLPTLASASSLRCITFKGNGTLINVTPRNVFPQITHLSLDCSMTLDLTLLFQNFPKLEHLALSPSRFHDAHHFQLPPQRDHQIVASSLHRLEVHLDMDMLDFGEPEKLEMLLGQLTLPALRTFAVVAPLEPRFDVQTAQVEARWENHAEWVRSPGIAALLARSPARARFECLDSFSGKVCVVGVEGSS